MVSPVIVSFGGRWDEERRRYEEGCNWEARHALHAALSCRSDLPLPG
jgi:hypothetical protein